MLRYLEEKAKAYQAPDFVLPGEGLIYATVGGSRAYGVVTPDSDTDIYGVCIPTIDQVFPHMQGVVPYFGQQVKPWLHWQYQGQNLDISVYSLVRFFDLAMKGNPNIIELLFTSPDLVMHNTVLGDMLVGSRDLFLTNNIIPRFLGFYYSQRNKLFEAPMGTEKAGLIEKYGYDSKAAYHSMRLLLELEQLLETGDMSLALYGDLLTGIRFGGFSPEDVKEMLALKAERVANKKEHSVLRDTPNEEYTKQCLLLMLETYYGRSLEWA